MGARTKARKRALDVLYSADVRGEALSAALSDEAARELADDRRGSSWAYAREIVAGVIEHGEHIDQLIEEYSHDWSLARMPAVDRAVLRIGVWELLYNTEVPNPVAISEGVNLAQEYSTDESAKFVNGVLGAVAES